EIHVERIDELPSVEERSDGDLHTGHAALQLKLPNLVRKGLLVRLEYADYVLSVILIAYEQTTLHITGRPRRLDDIALGISLHVGDRVVEVVEVSVGHDVDTLLLKFLLPEGAIVLESVRVRRASDHELALCAQRLSLVALAERVVEHNDVGPVHLALPVAHFLHETVGDITPLLILDAIPHFVTFLGHLPGDVADETRNRNEKKLTFVAVH